MENTIENNQGPEAAITRLKEGNKRFVSGIRAVEPLLSHLKMRELAENGQKPFAIVLTCSDSRSPVEMLFDQGLGDLFVVRVAGNVVAPSLLASIEFAAANFGSAAIVVLGHTSCGAVGAAVRHAKNPAEKLPSPHLEELVGRIRPAVDATTLYAPIDSDTFTQLAVIENVKRSMRLIREQSSIVRQLEEKNQIAIVGGVLEIATGEVSFPELTA